ncbi:hypothetical protein [Kitasatospora sp. NPDC088783]|uniref:hypothetical protein n=1 Tax=Kitasatospora sp. NPDC088783 TaxID=3364077 RepID=UPI00381098C1
MNPDRRPLGLTFSEPAVDQVLPADARPLLLPEQNSPFLEPETGLPAPSAAGG